MNHQFFEQLVRLPKKAPPIRFTTWEEWNDCLAKMNAGLVVCPDCGEWVSKLYEIPERYRNLQYKHTLKFWENHPDYDGQERVIAELERIKETTEYCCEYCISHRADIKVEFERSERYDKCRHCGEWVEKGSVKWHKNHASAPPEMLCCKCIELKEAEYLQFKLNFKERQRVRINKDRTARLGLVSDLTIDEWLEIIQKYDSKCAYCGGRWTDLEHIIPVSKGGGTTKTNVVPACRKCNTARSEPTVHG